MLLVPLGYAVVGVNVNLSLIYSEHVPYTVACQFLFTIPLLNKQTASVAKYNSYGMWWHPPPGINLH